MPQSPSRSKLFAAALTVASAAVVAGGVSLASAVEGPSANEPVTTVSTSASTAPTTAVDHDIEHEVDESTTESTEAPGPSTTDHVADDAGEQTGTTEVHPDNHGSVVSAAARDKSLTVDGNHGRAVSQVAREGAPSGPSTSVPQGSSSAPTLPSQGETHAGGHLPG